MPLTTTFLARRTFRGLTAAGVARRYGSKIQRDLEDREIRAVPVTQSPKPFACTLTVQVTCNKSLVEALKEVFLSKLAMELRDVL